jgi:hypothetical protein
VTWVSWRLQRTETLIAAAILALLAALLIPTGIQMAHAYDSGDLSTCLGQHTSENCAAAVQSFSSRFNSIANLTSWFTLVPGLIGVLLAAPFVLELENGTYRLAWTQSITRGRWIATKLAVTIGVALVSAAAMTLLIIWWRAPLVRLDGRMESSVFDFQGTVAIGYVLFALGLALAVGVVWRRTAPALVVAFIGYIAARIFVDTWLRRRFEAPLTATWREFISGVGAHPTRGAPPAALEHAWVLSQYPSDRFGHPLHVVLGPCVRATATHSDALRCLAPRGGGYNHVVFQPASRFWLFQGIETALFGGVAVALIVFAAWWTHRRTA